MLTKRLPTRTSWMMRREGSLFMVLPDNGVHWELPPLEYVRAGRTIEKRLCQHFDTQSYIYHQ